MPEIVRFATFEVDLGTGELRRSGKARARLQEQPLRILAALVARPGELVTRETLEERLWPTAAYGDHERGINKSVQKLRAALGDSAPSPRFIETVPRRGYRFLAPVEQVGDGDRASPGVAAASDAVAEEPAGRLRSATARLVFFATLAVTVVVLLGLLRERRLVSSEAAAGGASPTGISAAPGPSLAILPFRELVPDGGPTPLGLGMADTLITKLSSLSGLVVRPTSSVAGLAGAGVDALTAGRQLQVDHVLEGSLQRDGGRVRVSVRLLRVADGQPLWAQVLDEEGRDLFELQDAISARVAARLAPGFSAEEGRRLARRHTASVEAWEAYVRGRYLFERERPRNLRAALAEFEHATELDPGFALAHAGITHAWAPLLTWGWAANTEGLEAAQAAAFRALSLDDRLAEVHTAVAIAHSLAWDWRGEEESYRRAIALNPNYGTAYNWYGFLLAAQGRFEEALAMQRRGHRLDPTGLVPNVLLASALHLNGRTDEAVGQLERTLELDPGNAWALSLLGRLHHERGELDLARSFYEQAGARESSACLAAERGRPEEARALLAERQRSLSSYVSPFDLAMLHACLGEADAAFAELERAYRERVATLMTLGTNRALAPLRHDPRFTDLVRRVGLAGAPVTGAAAPARRAPPGTALSR